MAVSNQSVLIGTAGWSLPKAAQEHFPKEGSHLERYAANFAAVEIDSSFYRPHRAATYRRWAEGVPEHFRFSVKLPKAITHELRLAQAERPLAAFLAEVFGLGEKLGCLLMQLPPSLAFDLKTAASFLRSLREETGAPIVCEARHPSWFEPEAEAFLDEFQVPQVAADPARLPAAGEPRGWRGFAYFRLHGSPRMYYSSYGPEFLAGLAGRIRECALLSQPVWCIFDNTTHGAAIPNALELLRMM